MIPYIKNSPTYTLNIPELSGGMNLRDGLNQVNDNQLTDAKNVWFKDGALRTRPRMKLNGQPYSVKVTECKKSTVKMHYDNSTVVNGVKYYLQVIEYSYPNGDYIDNKFILRYVSEDMDIIELGSVTVSEIDWIVHNYLCFQHNGDIYLFTGTDRAFMYVIKRIGEGTYQTPKQLTEEDMTVPLVATNGLANNQGLFEGTLINGYNLLGAYFKAIYSTVNPDVKDPWEDGTYHTMLYTSPANTLIKKEYYPLYAGLKVIAKHLDENGVTSTHEVILDKNGHGEEPMGTNHPDGLVIEATPAYIEFYVDDDETPIKYQAKIMEGDLQILNNLEVTFPAPKPYGFEKVVNMTRAVWFGGASYGLYGGSRLFLGGNTSGDEQALVVWSDLNDPLYFSENNYAYVGDKAQAVVTFGKQADTLIILKERETYQTQYVASDAPTAEEVINQSVLDLSTTSAYFPMTLVHGYIGCDCPDTVQLCRNRLVWANKNGKVYTLVSQNQYNERAIYEVSEMVERRLKGEGQLHKAYAVDYDGYYVLQTGSHLYVMDYNSYGYTYIASHSKTEDANIKIPWYYWELPKAPECIMATANMLMMPIVDSEDVDEINLVFKHHYDMAYIDGTSGDDYKGQHIPSFVQTKLFDFGQPSKYKSVPTVNMSLGHNDNAPVKIEFISEQMIEDEHEITVGGVEAEKYSPQYTRQCRLFPYTKGTVSFGVRISCEGDLAVDSISLQYKTLGGAK